MRDGYMLDKIEVRPESPHAPGAKAAQVAAAAIVLYIIVAAVFLLYALIKDRDRHYSFVYKQVAPKWQDVFGRTPGDFDSLDARIRGFDSSVSSAAPRGSSKAAQQFSAAQDEGYRGAKRQI